MSMTRFFTILLIVGKDGRFLFLERRSGGRYRVPRSHMKQHKTSWVSPRVNSWIVFALLPAAVSLYLLARVSAQSQPDEIPGLAELKKGQYEQAVKLLGE